MATFDVVYNNHNVEAYATQIAKQLKRSSAIIINGSPVIPGTNSDSKLEFQKKWLAAPMSQHQLNSFDCHLIPGTAIFIVNAACRVKFDESGRNKLGESADLVGNEQAALNKNRPIWSSWFGVNINLVIDEPLQPNNGGEIISSINYRITYSPESSVIQL